MDPRSEILLDETIQAIHCALHPVPLWHGGQCVIHIGAGEKAPNNEGESCSSSGNYRRTSFVCITTRFLVPGFGHDFQSLRFWPDVPIINSCDAGYRICAILSVLGRVAIVSELAFIASDVDRLTDHHFYPAICFISVVLGARTYALFNRSKIILVIFGSLGLTVIAVAVVGIRSYLRSSG